MPCWIGKSGSLGPAQIVQLLYLEAGTSHAGTGTFASKPSFCYMLSPWPSSLWPAGAAPARDRSSDFTGDKTIEECALLCFEV